MEGVEYVGHLAKVARATIHVLERELTLPHTKRERRQLASKLSDVREDLARLELVGG